MLILDSGNLFFKSTAVADFLKDQWKEQAEFLVASFNEMGSDGVGMGQNEFALGLDFLKKLQSKANFPFLSSNIVDAKSKKLLFKPYVIKKAGAFNFGVFSVIDHQLPLAEGISATDSLNAAQKMVETLKPKSDFIIAITHQGLAKDITLASQVSGIDFIVGGHDGRKLHDPRVVGNTVILQAADRGRYVGAFEVTLKKDVHQFVTKGGIDHATQQLVFIDAKLKNIEKMKNGDLYAKDSQFKSQTNQKEKQVMLQKKALEKRIQQSKTASSHFKNEIHAMDKEGFGKGDASIFAKVQSLKDKLANLEQSKKEPETVFKGKLHFATYKKCQQCHKAQYDIWKDSPHASAMLPLYLRNQHNNPECIGCHTVGFQKPGGFTKTTQPMVLDKKTRQSTESFLSSLFDLKLSDVPKAVLKDKEVASAIKNKKVKGSMLDLREHPEFNKWIRAKYVKEIEKKKFQKDFSGVQCESCHGARGLKDGKPHFNEGGFSKKVAKDMCLQCHIPPRDSDFNFAKDLNIKGTKDAKFPFQCSRGVF